VKVFGSEEGFMKSSKLLYRSLFSALAALVCVEVAAGIADPIERPAAILSASQHPALLDVTRAGDRLVAVGERGVILVSTDNAKSWIQSGSPVAVTLTAVQFVTPLKGWAVGHSGVVLHTNDGGTRWTRQLDGIQAAKAVLKAAQSDSSAGADSRLKIAQQFAAEGADKPFLAVSFENEMRGVAVGAYGLIFGTEDGGATWTPWLDKVPNPKGLHLYAVHLNGMSVYLAGEQGLFVRSKDGGQSFTAIETPYRGSYFTLTTSNPDQLVLGGLRGNAYRFDTSTESFQKLEVQIPVTLSASTRLTDGRTMFVNQAGQLLISSGDSLMAMKTPSGAPAIAVVPTADGALAVATWNGVKRVDMRVEMRVDMPAQQQGKP
jgi:photosystem II stability/assembly factor-like uncharacterized protein